MTGSICGWVCKEEIIEGGGGSNFAVILKITHSEQTYTLTSELVRDMRHITGCHHLLSILLVSRNDKVTVKNKEPNHKM